MNKPWSGNNMGHKIYKIKNLNEQLVSKKKQKKENEKEKENAFSEMRQSNRGNSMVVKTPFSVVSEVTDFLTNPILSERRQEVFLFDNNNINNEFHELETQLITTSNYYYEEPYCKMVSSKIFENRILFELDIKKNTSDIPRINKVESSWVPIHNFIVKNKDIEFENYITGELPIELGRYKTEISLQEVIDFKNRIKGFQNISQDVILTESKLLLSKRTERAERADSHSKEIVIDKGTLFVKGHILQTIECLIDNKQSRDNFYCLMQNIELEVVVKILQKQELSN
ncbi:hypothetical protein COK41_16015 [Bacillus cereus]|nr:hypothetical protein COK41_16015 [Bacillus cereus]